MKSRIIAVATLSVLLGVVVWLVWPMTPREPIYQGKPLSEWVIGFITATNQIGRNAAAMVVVKAGTNTLPTLLRMMRAHDSPLKAQVLALVGRQNFIKIKHTDPWLINRAAVMGGFELLGPKAAPAVPELMRIYEEALSSDSQAGAAFALAEIGQAAKPAVPLLLRQVGNIDDSVREGTFDALSRIQSDPSQVVPVLINGLRDPNDSIRIDSAKGLGYFGQDAESAVPALAELVRKLRPPNLRPDHGYDTHFVGLGEFAFNALKQINPKAAERLAVEIVDNKLKE